MTKELFEKFGDVENLTLDDMETMISNPMNLMLMTKMAKKKNPGMSQDDKMALMKAKMAAKKKKLVKQRMDSRTDEIKKKL